MIPLFSLACTRFRKQALAVYAVLRRPDQGLPLPSGGHSGGDVVCSACVLWSLAQTGANHPHERRTAEQKEPCCMNRITQDRASFPNSPQGDVGAAILTAPWGNPAHVPAPSPAQDCQVRWSSRLVAAASVNLTFRDGRHSDVGRPLPQSQGIGCNLGGNRSPRAFHGRLRKLK
jgi:hypothetical protein